MIKFGFIKKSLFSMVIVVLIVLFAYIPSQAQLPVSYYYTQPLAFSSYTYYNTISDLDPYLLGFNTFSPFLAPAVTPSYILADVPIFPYLTNPYTTAFPYATLDVLAPYAAPAYPTFTYGDPALYSLWLDLNL